MKERKKENDGITNCVFEIKQSVSAWKHKMSPVQQSGLYYGESGGWRGPGVLKT